MTRLGLDDSSLSPRDAQKVGRRGRTFARSIASSMSSRDSIPSACYSADETSLKKFASPRLTPSLARRRYPGSHCNELTNMMESAAMVMKMGTALTP